MLNSRDNQTQRLAVGAQPIEGESLPGFVMRLSHRLRFSSSGRLAAMAGLRQPGSGTSDHDLSKLALLSGADVALLEKATYRRAARHAHHRFMGVTLGREFIRLDTRRWCPVCLSNFAYHRTLWDFALICACEVHRIPLADRCPKCGRKSGWHFPEMSRCRCGADLCRAAPNPVPVGVQNTTLAMVSLLKSDEPDWLPTDLQGCDRADIIWLVMCLGFFLTGWKKQRRIETLVAAGDGAVTAVTTAGVNALRDWPRSIHCFLAQEEQGAASRKGRQGARKTLGVFYDWMNTLGAGTMKDALDAAVASYIAKDPAVVLAAHRSRLGARIQQTQVVNLKSAAKSIGSSGTRVKRLMKVGVLPGVPEGGRGIPMAIDSEAVQAAASSFADAIDLATTARKLAVSKSRVRELVKAGMITPIHNAAGLGRWAFPISSIETLLQPAIADPQEPLNGKLVGFEYVVEALRRRGIVFGDAVKMIETGRPKVIARNEQATGFKRFIFSALDVRAICREIEANGHLTIQAAAEALGLKWAVVSNLVERGLLVAVDGKLTKAEVERFRREFVTGAALAKEWGTSPRSLAVKLASQGLAPIAGPTIDGSRQNIYVKSGVSMIRPSQSKN